MIFIKTLHRQKLFPGVMALGEVQGEIQNGEGLKRRVFCVMRAMLSFSGVKYGIVAPPITATKPAIFYKCIMPIDGLHSDLHLFSRFNLMKRFSLKQRLDNDASLVSIAQDPTLENEKAGKREGGKANREGRERARKTRGGCCLLEVNDEGFC